MISNFTELKRNFNGSKKTSLHTLWKPPISRKWKLLTPCLVFSTVFVTLLCLCHRRIIYAALMAFDEISQVYKTDATAYPHTRPEQHIITLPSLPKNEHKGRVESFMDVTITVIVMTQIFLPVFIKVALTVLH